MIFAAVISNDWIIMLVVLYLVLNDEFRVLVHSLFDELIILVT